MPKIATFGFNRFSQSPWEFADDDRTLIHLDQNYTRNTTKTTEITKILNLDEKVKSSSTKITRICHSLRTSNA